MCVVYLKVEHTLLECTHLFSVWITHFRSEISLPRNLIMAVVNMKLEKTVKRPAMPAKRKREYEGGRGSKKQIEVQLVTEVISFREAVRNAVAKKSKKNKNSV